MAGAYRPAAAPVDRSAGAGFPMSSTPAMTAGRACSRNAGSCCSDPRAKNAKPPHRRNVASSEAPNESRVALAGRPAFLLRPRDSSTLCECRSCDSDGAFWSVGKRAAWLPLSMLTGGCQKKAGHRGSGCQELKPLGLRSRLLSRSTRNARGLVDDGKRIRLKPGMNLAAEIKSGASTSVEKGKPMETRERSDNRSSGFAMVCLRTAGELAVGAMAVYACWHWIGSTATGLISVLALLAILIREASATLVRHSRPPLSTCSLYRSR
jgi:hypothetical protein